MNVTCHMTPMAHRHGVRYSLHRLPQPERGFAALADADRGLVKDKVSVRTKRQVKLSKNLFLQFIIEIDVKS